VLQMLAHVVYGLLVNGDTSHSPEFGSAAKEERAASPRGQVIGLYGRGKTESKVCVAFTRDFM